MRTAVAMDTVVVVGAALWPDSGDIAEAISVQW